MDDTKLQAALAGEKAYRVNQAKEAVYRTLISDWSEATALPPAMREKLSAECPVSSLTVVSESTSQRGDTTKCALKCADGQVIETVLMRHQASPQRKHVDEDDDEHGRNTVCVSSQAGCPMACAFCATGTMGLKRNLAAHEIVEQVLYFMRKLKQEGEVVTNVVLMGMGEPFHNYDNVMTALRTLNDAKGTGFGVRRLSISTCGIVPGILKLADDPARFNLAISLHAPNDALRSNLMPVNKAYPLAKLFDAIKTYLTKTNRKVMFEYLLIEGVNDTPEIAHELADLLIKENPANDGTPTPLYHVNLIKYHTTEVLGAAAERFGLTVNPSTGKSVFPSSPVERRKAFQQVLYDRGISCTHRITFGEDINAACGQLANKSKNA